MPSLANVVEVIVKGTSLETSGKTRNVWNIFHFMQYPALPGPQTALAVGNAFIANVWTPAIAPVLSIGYTGVECDARYLDDTTFPWSVCNVPASGAVALPRLSSAEAVVFILKTNLRGRNYRGRKHFGPVPSAHVTNDELNAGGVTAWSALIPYMAAQLTVGGQTYVSVVLSTAQCQLRKNPVTLVGAQITSALMNKTIGTMRHRKELTVR